MKLTVLEIFLLSFFLLTTLGLAIYAQRLHSDLKKTTKTLHKKEEEQWNLKIAHTHLQERHKLQEELQKNLEHQIKSLCNDVMERATRTLLHQSKNFMDCNMQATQNHTRQQTENLTNILKPFEKSLHAIRENVTSMEEKRSVDHENLTTHMGHLRASHSDLQKQTQKLLRGLTTPQVRGRWGEVQLKRIVEWSGMLPFCDFSDQHTLASEDKIVRPDLLIRLPFGRSIIVDAKAPMVDLLDSTPETESPENSDSGPSKTKNHSKQLRLHIKSLDRKQYSTYLKTTPDFVILFIPNEGLLIKALEEDPDILDYSGSKSVLLATPMTLIALLKTIALGWHQHTLNKNAQKVADLSSELIQQFSDFMIVFKKLGKNLEDGQKIYAKIEKTVEKKLLPKGDTIRTLSGKDLGAPSVSAPQNIDDTNKKVA